VPFSTLPGPKDFRVAALETLRVASHVFHPSAQGRGHGAGAITALQVLDWPSSSDTSNALFRGRSYHKMAPHKSVHVSGGIAETLKSERTAPQTTAPSHLSRIHTCYHFHGRFKPRSAGECVRYPVRVEIPRDHR